VKAAGKRRPTALRVFSGHWRDRPLARRLGSGDRLEVVDGPVAPFTKIPRIARVA
jgi:hypothetical protein